MPVHITLQQFVCADNDIHLAFSGIIQHLLLLFGAAETGKNLNPHRPVGETVTEVIIMLLRQQGGRHQDGHLLVVIDGEERRPHRDLGFPETDIAAHQPVHCHRLTHIAQHGIDSLFLICGGFKRERLTKFAVLFAIMLKRETGFDGPLCINIQ